MSVADERIAFETNESKGPDDSVMSARRRRRIRKLESQFRFLSALVGKQQEIEPHSAGNISAGRDEQTDLRAALWLLRRSRK
jgi:hypothetical protein